MAKKTEAAHTTQTGGRPATTGVIPGRYALSVGLPDKTPPSGWKWTALSDVARLESGHTPSRRFPEYWDGDIPWIGIKDATDNHGRVIFDTYQHVTQEGIDNSSARMLPAGTVCLSRTASVGFVVVMGRSMSTSQDFVNWICSEEIDNHFLKYVLVSEHDSMLRFASGTTHQTIYYPEAKAFHVCLPDINEQRAIAGILGALDDKIELNRRMNRTLESMARAVFRQWFINDEDVYKWEMGYLSDIAYVVKGVSYRSADLVEDSDTALVTLKSMERGGGYREDGLKPYAGEYKPTQKLVPGEVVIAHTDLTQAADVIGRAARVESSEKHPNLVASLDMAIVRPKEKPYTNEYLYGLLSQTEFSDHAYGYTNGTTVLHLSTKALPEYQFRIPPKNKVEEYSRFASPIFQRIDSNKKESRTLASLRDSLLPKLMRGEVRVKS